MALFSTIRSTMVPPFLTSVIFADVASFLHDISVHIFIQIHIYISFTFLVKLIKLILINSQQLYTFSFHIHLVSCLSWQTSFHSLCYITIYYIARFAPSFATCNKSLFHIAISSTDCFYLALSTSVINFFIN